MAVNRRYKEEKDYPTRQTGSVAQLLGLSDEGVRIYERYGLVYPEKREDNGFRSFDIMDMVMLLYARVYRECGFSLKEARRLANHCSLEELSQAYGESILSLHRKVEWERWRLERVEELLSEIQAAGTGVGQCTLSTMPGMYRVEFLLNNRKVDPSPEKQRRVRRWMETCIPFAMLSTRYVKETITRPKAEIIALSGLGIYEKYAGFLELREEGDVEYSPPVPAVHTILQANNQELIPDFSPCLSFLKSQGLRISGDVISFGIANLHFQTDFDRLFHLWIPVEKG